MVVRFGFDFGNFEGKWYTSDIPARGSFTHALAQLSDSAYADAIRRDNRAPGIIRVNDVPFAVGMAARRHTTKARPRGAARYTTEYYGTALAFALSEAFIQPEVEVALALSYPPGDVRFSARLENIAKREWLVQANGRDQRFIVTEVLPFDEPLGGASHVMLRNDGNERRNNPLANKSVLVVDIGGWTTDTAPFDNGDVDYEAADSVRDAGTVRLIEQFEDELRTRYLDEFQTVGVIDIRRLEEGLRTGIYPFGKIGLDCKDFASELKNAFVNDILQIIVNAGGVANFDAILLTGGGAALIYDLLVAALPNVEIILAESNLDMLRYANVLGGVKMLNLMQRAAR